MEFFEISKRNISYREYKKDSVTYKMIGRYILMTWFVLKLKF